MAACRPPLPLVGKARKIHLFDSFEGLPPAKEELNGKTAIEYQANPDGPEYFDNCTAEEAFAREAMRLADHSNYVVYKGWFEQRVPVYPQRPIAILRLDGDWYESIYVCLEHLFPHVTPGGIVILDEYLAWDGCVRAVHDYLSRTQSTSRLLLWHDTVSYIVKKV
jgi:O-methyltransferase